MYSGGFGSFFVRSGLGTLRKRKKGRGKNSGCLFSSEPIIQLDRDVAMKCPLVAGRALRGREGFVLWKELHQRGRDGRWLSQRHRVRPALALGARMGWRRARAWSAPRASLLLFLSPRHMTAPSVRALMASLALGKPWVKV